MPVLQQATSTDKYVTEGEKPTVEFPGFVLRDEYENVS